MRVVCTTDDPADDLAPHRAARRATRRRDQAVPDLAAGQGAGVHDLPAWNAWLDRLEAAGGRVDRAIARELRDALASRHERLPRAGCRASDHGLERIFAARRTPTREVQAIFAKARAGTALDADEASTSSRSALLYDFAVMDHARGWVQQFHLGAAAQHQRARLRSPRAPTPARLDRRLRRRARRWRASSIASTAPAASRRPMLYNLNPADNEVFATMIGNFQDGSVPGKMQFGSAWWFLDQKDGMEKQISALSQHGPAVALRGHGHRLAQLPLLSRATSTSAACCATCSATTSSAGGCPDDRALLGRLIEDICFRNARPVFRLRPE